MREGWAAMNDNRFRFSIDVRGNGAAAWRFLTGNANAGAYIETLGPEERPVLPFRSQPTRTSSAGRGTAAVSRSRTRI